MPYLRVTLLVVLASLPASVARADQTDDFIRAEMARQHIPGLALAVVKNGETVRAQGYGLADPRLGTPVAADTVFNIGSVSKQFIATDIMLLAQDGRLKLDDRVSMHLPGAPDIWQAITIRHLLTHTAGLVREAPGYTSRISRADADVIRDAYDTPLRFAPGEKWEYSNLGYFVLAEVIRLVSGQPWKDFLRERVFMPAGMTATDVTASLAQAPGRARGFTDNDNVREALDLPAVRPSGAFKSTVVDLARWDKALYSDQILTDASRRQMWTAVALSDGTPYPYGFGWQLGDISGHRQVHHGGAINGFLAEFTRLLDDRLTVIVLINLDDADVESIARGVATLALQTPAGR
jgi:CubicO group peptidase (beta-lactamase class C family)